MLDQNLFGGNSFIYPAKGNSYICYKTLDKGDRQEIIDGFKKLSAKSVHHRFFGSMKELTTQQLEELLDTDKRNHVAWAAFDIIGEDANGVGIGRFKRSETEPKEAELALTVIDEYQNKSVGTSLLGIMYFLASKLDIEIFTGIIMSDNGKLIKRFKELGAIMKRVGSEYEMSLPIYKNIDDIPDTRYSRILRPILLFLKENDFCALL